MPLELLIKTITMNFTTIIYGFAKFGDMSRTLEMVDPMSRCGYILTKETMI
jgi:pentatricopeptide repeat protein